MGKQLLEWIYCGKVFTENDIDNNYGFVYIITNNLTGRKYIGKKLFWSAKTKQVNKKKKRFKSFGEKICNKYMSCQSKIQIIF